MSNNSGNKSILSTGSSASVTGNNKNDGVRTKYAIVKEGWGSRSNFQLPGKLRLGKYDVLDCPPLDPESMEEGNLILEGYQNADREEAKMSGKSLNN